MDKQNFKRALISLKGEGLERLPLICEEFLEAGYVPLTMTHVRTTNGPGFILVLFGLADMLAPDVPSMDAADVMADGAPEGEIVEDEPLPVTAEIHKAS